jgi:hypothetical protein
MSEFPRGRRSDRVKTALAVVSAPRAGGGAAGPSAAAPRAWRPFPPIRRRHRRSPWRPTPAGSTTPSTAAKTERCTSGRSGTACGRHRPTSVGRSSALLDPDPHQRTSRRVDVRRGCQPERDPVDPGNPADEERAGNVLPDRRVGTGRPRPGERCGGGWLPRRQPHRYPSRAHDPVGRRGPGTGAECPALHPAHQRRRDAPVLPLPVRRRLQPRPRHRQQSGLRRGALDGRFPGLAGTSGGQTVQKVVDRVLAALQPGEIVLMHVGSHPTDGSMLDAAALPQIIDAMRARGYRFVTMTALTGG